jgi:folate-binding protein YgfZ
MKFEAPVTTIGILCHASSATALHKHLSKYLAFFRGTTLKHTPQSYRGFGLFADITSIASTNSNLASNHSLSHWSDNRSMLWIDTAAPDSKEALSFATSHEPTDLTQWQSADIQQKRLWLNEKQVERWIPQNFSLDELDGISFTKGCYTGQEVVARLHYKGQSKKRLFAFITKSSVSVELKFENIYEDSGSIGDVIESCRFEGKTYGLAILKVDKTELPLFADENQQFEIQLLH